MARKKNTFGKSRDVDNPYAIYKGYSRLVGNIEYRILKTYQTVQNEDKNKYARWFVAAKSDATHGSWEYGDMYLREVVKSGFLTYADEEWAQEYYGEIPR